ncbi:MAG: hypothetical protein J6N78_04640 [Clostridia bacterium]|nr:hypothetical protein [Clostridia bacterium]
MAVNIKNNEDLSGVRLDDLYSDEQNAILQRRISTYASAPHKVPTLQEMEQQNRGFNTGYITNITRPSEYDTGENWGDSRYDKAYAIGYEPGDVADRRASEQSFIAKLSAGIGKGAVLTGTTIGDTIGTIVGLGEALAAWDASKIFDNDITRSMASINEWAEQLMPNYRSRNEMNGGFFDKLVSWNTLADFTKNAGFMVGSYITGGWITKGLGLIGTLMRGEKAIARMGAITPHISALFGALGEASFEAQTNSTDWLKQQTAVINGESQRNIAAIRQQYGDTDYANALVAEEESKRQAALQQVNDRAGNMGIADFIANIPILYASNMFMLGRAFTKGFDKTAMVGNRVSKDIRGSINDFARTTIKETGETVGKEVGETAAKEAATGPYSVNKWLSNPHLRRLSKLGTPLEEGNEELAQGAVSRASGYYYENDYYTDGLDTENQRTTGQFLNSALRGVKEAYNISDPNQFIEGISGFLWGAIGVPHFRTMRNENGKWQSPIELVGGVYNQSKEDKERAIAADELAKTLNSRVTEKGDKSINSLVRRVAKQNEGFVRHLKTEENKERALEEGDKKTWLDEDHKQLVSDIQMFANAGKLDDLRGLVNTALETSDENIQQILDVTAKTDENGKNIGVWADANGNPVSNIKEQLEERKQTILDEIDRYEESMQKIDQRTMGILSNDYLEELVYLDLSQQNKARRLQEVQNKLRPTIESLTADIENNLREELRERGVDKTDVDGIVNSLLEAESRKDVKEIKEAFINNNESYNEKQKEAINDVVDQMVKDSLALKVIRDSVDNLEKPSDDAMMDKWSRKRYVETELKAINNAITNQRMAKALQHLRFYNNESDVESPDDFLQYMYDAVEMKQEMEAFRQKYNEYTQDPEKIKKDREIALDQKAKEQVQEYSKNIEQQVQQPNTTVEQAEQIINDNADITDNTESKVINDTKQKIINIYDSFTNIQDDLNDAINKIDSKDLNENVKNVIKGKVRDKIANLGKEIQVNDVPNASVFSSVLASINKEDIKESLKNDVGREIVGKVPLTNANMNSVLDAVDVLFDNVLKDYKDNESKVQQVQKPTRVKEKGTITTNETKQDNDAQENKQARKKIKEDKRFEDSTEAETPEAFPVESNMTIDESKENPTQQLELFSEEPVNTQQSIINNQQTIQEQQSNQPIETTQPTVTEQQEQQRQEQPEIQSLEAVQDKTNTDKVVYPYLRSTHVKYEIDDTNDRNLFDTDRSAKPRLYIPKTAWVQNLIDYMYDTCNLEKNISILKIGDEIKVAVDLDEKNNFKVGLLVAKDENGNFTKVVGSLSFNKQPFEYKGMKDIMKKVNEAYKDSSSTGLKVIDGITLHVNSLQNGKLWFNKVYSNVENPQYKTVKELFGNNPIFVVERPNGKLIIQQRDKNGNSTNISISQDKIKGLRYTDTISVLYPMYDGTYVVIPLRAPSLQEYYSLADELKSTHPLHQALSEVESVIYKAVTNYKPQQGSLADLQAVINKELFNTDSLLYSSLFDNIGLTYDPTTNSIIANYIKYSREGNTSVPYSLGPIDINNPQTIFNNLIQGALELTKDSNIYVNVPYKNMFVNFDMLQTDLDEIGVVGDYITTTYAMPDVNGNFIEYNSNQEPYNGIYNIQSTSLQANQVPTSITSVQNSNNNANIITIDNTSYNVEKENGQVIKVTNQEGENITDVNTAIKVKQKAETTVAPKRIRKRVTKNLQSNTRTNATEDITIQEDKSELLQQEKENKLKQEEKELSTIDSDLLTIVPDLFPGFDENLNNDMWAAKALAYFNFDLYATIDFFKRLLNASQKTIKGRKANIKSIQRYKEMLSMLEPPPYASVKEELAATKSDRQIMKEIALDDTYTNLYDYAASHLYSDKGVLLWEDRSGNKRGVINTIFGKTPNESKWNGTKHEVKYKEEKKNVAWLLATKGQGVTVAEYSHQLWENRPEYFKDYTDQDVLNVIEEVIKSIINKHSLVEIALENHAFNADLAVRDYELQQIADAHEEYISNLMKVAQYMYDDALQNAVFIANIKNISIEELNILNKDMFDSLQCNL